jgi:formylglycine-generating enzyme
MTWVGRATGRLVLLSVLALSSAAQDPATPTITIDLGGGVTMDLALIKAGTFTQGSRAREADRGDDETEREVTISKDFFIGRTEVTIAQFRRFVEDTKYKTEAERGTSGGFGWDGRALAQRPEFNWRHPGFEQTDAHPVTIVTFDDAVAFANWLSRKAGRPVALPTEAQWEFAARQGASSAYPSADPKAKPSDLGWSKANAGNGTRAVAQKAANGAGLFDMTGNVAEWCLDWYGPYASGAATDPVETRQDLSDKPRRVLRGGSWIREPIRGRSAARYRSAAGSRNADVGFRVVASVEASPSPSGTSAATPDGPPSDLGGRIARVLAAMALMVGVVVGGVFVLMRRVLNRLRFGRTGKIDTRLDDDGFVIRAPKVPAGHRIHYQYTVDGVSRTGDVVYAGDGDHGQMVYTGARPTLVQIVAVTAPGEVMRSRTSREDAVSDISSTSSTSDRFRGHPSAY